MLLVFLQIISLTLLHGHKKQRAINHCAVLTYFKNYDLRTERSKHKSRGTEILRKRVHFTYAYAHTMHTSRWLYCVIKDWKSLFSPFNKGPLESNIIVINNIRGVVFFVRCSSSQNVICVDEKRITHENGKSAEFDCRMRELIENSIESKKIFYSFVWLGPMRLQCGYKTVYLMSINIYFLSLFKIDFFVWRIFLLRIFFFDEQQFLTPQESTKKSNDTLHTQKIRYTVFVFSFRI